MKALIKSIAALAMLAFSAPAFAGGVTVAEEGDSKLKIGAKFYVNLTSQKTTDQAGTLGKTTGVAVDRAYFSAGYAFNDIWSMGLTTDFQIESGLKKRSNVYIKKAYLQGKFSDAVILQAGIIGTPWIGYEEGLMRHRYVNKTFVDTYKLDSSADAGIGFKGKLADGLFAYHVTEVNGAGYGNISKTNAMDFNGRIGVYPVEGLTLDFQYRDGYKGTKTWDPVKQANVPGVRHTLLQGMASYGMDSWRIGGNLISEKAKDKAARINPITKTNGYVAWGWANFADSLGAFGRYEYLKVKKDGTIIQPKTTRYVAGLEWFARKNVTFSLAYDYSKTKDNGFVKGNFVKNTKAGLFSEIKF